jgi:hypothetical protein
MTFYVSPRITFMHFYIVSAKMNAFKKIKKRDLDVSYKLSYFAIPFSSVRIFF